MIKLKAKVNSRRFKSSINRLVKNLPGTIRVAMNRGGRAVAANVRTRLFQGGKTSKTVRLVSGNIKSSGAIVSGNSITVGIGNISQLDAATQVMAASTGQTYNLWRLLEFGWGQRGGFRAGPYEIEPLERSTRGRRGSFRNQGTKRKGVGEDRRTASQRRPALSFYAGGKLVFASNAKHPGFAGRHFFLDQLKSWYTQDREEMMVHIEAGINQLVRKLSHNQGRTNL